MEELIQELRKLIRGEVRFDKYSRVLYSTDASIYQIEPRGVVIPHSADDVQAVVELAAAHKVPIIARGGGTSLVGQSIGDGIIIDFSKYLNRILEVNREERSAWIEPGVVLDQLNNHVAADGLFFGPDVATSSRANLGGLVGNNSSGARSVVYGKTIDHILELDVILSDGSRARLRPASRENPGKTSNTFLDSLQRETLRIADENAGEIERRYPKIMRRVAGYNLDEFAGREQVNLSKMIVGSEGTLAVVTGIKVNLVPKLKHRVLGVLHFVDLFSALEAVNPILEFKPSAIELIDDVILNLTRDTQEYARRMTFVEGRPGALLLVEFQGDSREEITASLKKLTGFLKKEKLGYAHIEAIDSQQQADIWYVRKAGLGLVLGTRGARKPVGFVEDTAVAPERLPEYIREFDRIIKDHGTEACYYAHASVGLLHIRPMLDLKSSRDIDNMRSIADAVSSLVLKYGGAFSGEHGDGLARSSFNEKMFGPQLYQAFRAIKRAFDPHNILNPGKIVDAQNLTENLRYEQRRLPEFKTFLDFSEAGGFDSAVEMCNGNGVCRKRDSGTMCPSYMATSEEMHSTRGRANALRAVLAGRLAPSEFTSERMKEVFDLCIACKGCKGECPTNVDMAKIKYEFLYQYHQVHGLPLRDRLFGHVETLYRLGCRWPGLSNWLLRQKAVRRLMQQSAGIASKRTLPPFAPQTFEKWFRSRPVLSAAGVWPQVALWHDTFVNYNYPAVGVAAVSLLEALGYEVILPEKKCCGRPLISRGMLAEARDLARYNVGQISLLAAQGIPVVGLEPSCILTFREEYLDMVADPGAVLAAGNTFLFEEFLASGRSHPNKLNLRPAAAPFLLHGHCHSKALLGMAETVALLKLIPQAAVEVVDSGCCGMAGSFGFEAEHYEISLAMGRRALFAAVESKGKSWQVVAPGVSCRQQIEHGTGRSVKHPVEILAEHLA